MIVKSYQIKPFPESQARFHKHYLPVQKVIFHHGFPQNC